MKGRQSRREKNKRVLLLQSNEKKKFQVSGQTTVSETADNSIRGKKEREREKSNYLFIYFLMTFTVILTGLIDKEYKD